MVINSISTTKNYDFKKINLILGNNNKGKTLMFNTIDLILGKSSLNIPTDIKNYEIQTLKFKLNINSHAFDGKLIFKDDIRKTFERPEFIIRNTTDGELLELNQAEYKNLLDGMIFGESLINGYKVFNQLHQKETNFSYRNFTVFNFFSEDYVGTNTVLLSRANSPKYRAMFQDTYKLATGIYSQDYVNNIIEIKRLEDEKRDAIFHGNKLKRMKEMCKQIENSGITYIYGDKLVDKAHTPILKETFKIKSEIKKLDSIISELKNFEIKNNFLTEIESWKSDLSSSNNEFIGLCKVVEKITDEIKSDDKLIRYLINRQNELVLFLKENKENMLPNENEKDSIIKYGEYSFLKKQIKDIQNSLDMEDIIAKINLLNVENKIIKENQDKVLNIIETKTMFYFAIGYERISIDKKIDLRELFIKLTGYSFDPLFYRPVKSKKIIEVFGSHAVATVLQIAYILALHEFFCETNSRYVLPIILLDSISQPFSEEKNNVSSVVKMIEVFHERNSETQIFFFDNNMSLKKQFSDLKDLSVYNLDELNGFL